MTAAGETGGAGGGWVRAAAEVPFEPVPQARGTFMQVLIGDADGAPNFFTRRFRIQPGGRIPAHRHDGIEHEQFVLSGAMVIGLDDEERQAAVGDALFIPAGTAHWYENRGDEPVEFLCIVPSTRRYQTEWLEAGSN